MKKPRLFLILLTLFFVLSFTFGAVKADVEPPFTDDEVDPEDTLITGDLPDDAVEVQEAQQRPDNTGWTMLPEDFTPPEIGEGDRALPGDPYSPNMQYVMDKTPTYIWYTNYSAIKYKVQVFHYYTNKLMYTIKAKPSNCSGGYCYKTPPDDLKLKTYDLGTNGYYYWRVIYTYDGINWYYSGNYAEFRVASKGFKSTFDVNANKWLSVFGTWSRVDPGYLKTGGVYGYSASAIQKEYFMDWYVFEAKMKRKNDSSSANRIYFHGYPYPNAENGWEYTYAFQYTNDGYYSLWERIDGDATALVNWTYSPYIIPYGWNTLEVYTDYPYIDFAINGQYIGWVYDTSLDWGWVGISMYDNGTYKDNLLVDWAQLYYTSTALVAERDPAMQLGLDGVVEGQSPDFFIP